MKILLCHNYYRHRGGEEETVFREKELLERNGHEVVLFTRNSREIDNFNFFQRLISLFEVVFSFLVYRRLKKIIEKESPDIVHVHNIFPLISPAVYYAAKSCHIPVVQTLHNYRFLCLNGLFLRNNGRICEKCQKGDFIYGILNKCYRRSFMQSLVMAFVLSIHRKIGTFRKKIDCFVAPCRFLKNKLIEAGFPSKKMWVKPHFTEIYDSARPEDFKNYAVYIGRLSKEKGLFTLVKAFKKINEVNLKILGEGAYRERLDNYITEEKIANVSLFGYIKGAEKDKILKRAMFLVLPSEWYENMPYAILESFACGVPVIASSIGGLRELVTDGYNGLLFEPGNAEDLAQKIGRLAGNKELLLEMRENARKTAEEKYSEKIGYKNLMAVYRRAKI